MVNIIPSLRFEKAIKHLNSDQRNKLMKILKKINQNPEVGKLLNYSRGQRALRVKPYRIVYNYKKEENTIYLIRFEHRKEVYK